MNIPNRLHIGDLKSMPVADIAALPVEQLAVLQDEIAAHLNDARNLKSRLDAALDRRFGQRAHGVRASHGKNTGTVRFEDGPVTIIADLPKRVVWDQEQLAAMAERIRAGGDDPAEYVDIAFKVPERKFTAWPAHIRTAFEGARTVKTGKPVFRLSLNNEVTT
ncbi:MAG TPA: hypothetical protein ENJ57_06125 [Rhizobiales bacterium]|nr:hypothetical protein [Hyphomicrobiales bacterium]